MTRMTRGAVDEGGMEVTGANGVEDVDGGNIASSSGMKEMTCGAINEGGVGVSGRMEVSRANGVDDVDGGNIISCVDRSPPLSASCPPPFSRP